jgi:hypothetical protein
MVEFQRHDGAVYILENSKAQRVKIGVTGNHKAYVIGRLNEVNRMWLELKATCQICGGRRLINSKGLIPQHAVSGTKCPGGNALPLERDVALAETRLDKLKNCHNSLSGSEKGSNTRIINKLEKRIALYRQHNQPVGNWQINTIFYTNFSGQVELLSHQILAKCLDKKALFGEVFCCSVSEAVEAVETAMNQLGVLQSVRREVQNYATSEKYGKCVICGNNLSETGACPDCMQRF